MEDNVAGVSQERIAYLEGLNDRRHKGTSILHAAGNYSTGRRICALRWLSVDRDLEQKRRQNGDPRTKLNAGRSEAASASWLEASGNRRYKVCSGALETLDSTANKTHPTE